MPAQQAFPWNAKKDRGNGILGVLAARKMGREPKRGGGEERKFPSFPPTPPSFQFLVPRPICRANNTPRSFFASQRT